MRLDPPSPLVRCLLLALLLLLPGASAAPLIAAPAPPEAGVLAQARELLDAERPEEAARLLQGYLAEHPDDPAALLLRGNARLMVGRVAAGRQDLERAVSLDPELREAWLNLGAVAIADERYGEALEAFLTAEELDPGAAENDLNIGAVLLLSGKLQKASERFRAYLEGGEASADSFYLVATNYAMAGYAALAVEHLRRAIELDERSRLKARTDRNFLALSGNREFQELLATDLYEPEPGAYRASRTFDAPYNPKGGRLLEAVLDTLQLSGATFDPRVEVTPEWALIWGDLRIKVSRVSEEAGSVEISAPPERFTPAEWRRRAERLFAGIERQLDG